MSILTNKFIKTNWILRVWKGWNILGSTKDVEQLLVQFHYRNLL